ncbi:MAG: phospholipase D family protein [Thiogranum sp.]|nr:phospholipase D family protein [Thiogranum sp.]
MLGDVEFENMLRRGAYHLVVGTDQITNTSTINRLIAYQDAHPSLTVNAFFHDTKNSLFHPKITYFSSESGLGSLVIGSGNLTAGGLRKNREAFAVITLSEQELINIEAYWNDWISQSANYLKPLTDPDVLKRVAANTIRAKAWRDISDAVELDVVDVPADSESTEESLEWKYQENSLVLFAELPRSGDRWNQANFDVNTFENYFGATAGDNSQRILLRNVISQGVLGDIEVRPSVSVASQNYRFELEAAAGLDYPANGRPIGVFIRLSTRMFIYKLFMPSIDAKYEEIVDWMNANWTGRADRMKRIVKEAGVVSTLLNGTSLSSFLVAQ